MRIWIGNIIALKVCHSTDIVSIRYLASAAKQELYLSDHKSLVSSHEIASKLVVLPLTKIYPQQIHSLLTQLRNYNT